MPTSGGTSAPTVGKLAAVPLVAPPPVRVRDPAWSFTLKRYRQASLDAASALPNAVRPPEGSITGPHHKLSGIASYYWQSQQTASGEMFDRRGFTAAHPTLPFNTRVRVTELRSGRSVIVRINDRGPYKPGRIIDLSEAAAEVLEMQKHGITPVKIEVVGH